MNQAKNLAIALLIVLGFVSLTCIYTVPETSRALLLQLGKLDTDSNGKPEIKSPGLHFKIPFVSQVIYLEKRLQTLEVEQSRILTRNKKDVIVDSYTKWRIIDFSRFYNATKGNTLRAKDLLRQMVNDSIRAEFGRLSVRDVVAGERVDIMDRLQASLVEGASKLGIQIADVRIKRIDLPQEVSESVFDRMRAEREQAATGHRANGERQANIIRAETDKTVRVTIAQAEKQSKTLIGEGDQISAKIYADAYKKNPEFYAFYQSLKTYQESFKNKDDLLVISPDSKFFRYFNNPEKNG